MTCQYCRLFLGSKFINQEDKIRKCIATGLEVNALSEICEVFEPAEYFYCFKGTQRINIKACINRQDSKKSLYGDCKVCSQGVFLRSMYSLLEKKRPKIIRPKDLEKKRPKIIRIKI